jgi:hypothetical protein
MPLPSSLEKIRYMRAMLCHYLHDYAVHADGTLNLNKEAKFISEHDPKAGTLTRPALHGFITGERVTNPGALAIIERFLVDAFPHCNVQNYMSSEEVTLATLRTMFQCLISGNYLQDKRPKAFGARSVMLPAT